MATKRCIREKQTRLLEISFLLWCNFKMSNILELMCSCLFQVYNGNPQTIDGCATFFRRDRFSHVKKYEVWRGKKGSLLAF